MALPAWGISSGLPGQLLSLQAGYQGEPCWDLLGVAKKYQGPRGPDFCLTWKTEGLCHSYLHLSWLRQRGVQGGGGPRAGCSLGDHPPHPTLPRGTRVASPSPPTPNRLQSPQSVALPLAQGPSPGAPGWGQLLPCLLGFDNRALWSGTPRCVSAPHARASPRQPPPPPGARIQPRASQGGIVDWERRLPHARSARVAVCKRHAGGRGHGRGASPSRTRPATRHLHR